MFKIYFFFLVKTLEFHFTKKIVIIVFDIFSLFSSFLLYFWSKFRIEINFTILFRITATRYCIITLFYNVIDGYFFFCIVYTIRLNYIFRYALSSYLLTSSITFWFVSRILKVIIYLIVINNWCYSIAIEFIIGLRDVYFNFINFGLFLFLFDIKLWSIENNFRYFCNLYIV